MNFSGIGCSHLECAHLHIRSVWLSVYSSSDLMNSKDTKEIKCMDGSYVFSVDHEIDFFFLYITAPKLASFGYTSAHVIGFTRLMSVLIQQCLRISASEDWPVKLFKLDFEIFAFRTFCYSLGFFLVVWLFLIFRQNIVHEWKGNIETRSGCLTVMIVVVRTPAAAPVQMKVRRRLLLCHPVFQLSRTTGRFILIQMANLAWVSMCCVSARSWILVDFSVCWVVTAPSEMLVPTEKGPKHLKGWGWLVLRRGIVWVLVNWNKRGFESWWQGRNSMGTSALLSNVLCLHMHVCVLMCIGFILGALRTMSVCSIYARAYLFSALCYTYNMFKYFFLY